MSFVPIIVGFCDGTNDCDSVGDLEDCDDDEEEIFVLPLGYLLFMVVTIPIPSPPRSSWVMKHLDESVRSNELCVLSERNIEHLSL